MTGAIIFGFSLSATNMLTQQLIQDRFLGRLKLMITLPISKAAYGFGVLAFATLTSLPVVILLLAMAPFMSVDFALTWVFFPLIVPILFGLAGITFIIASYAPSMEAGSIMGNLFGVVLVVISPVFFTVDQAPTVLRWLGCAESVSTPQGRHVLELCFKTLLRNTTAAIERLHSMH